MASWVPVTLAASARCAFCRWSEGIWVSQGLTPCCPPDDRPHPHPGVQRAQRLCPATLPATALARRSAAQPSGEQGELWGGLASPWVSPHWKSGAAQPSQPLSLHTVGGSHSPPSLRAASGGRRLKPPCPGGTTGLPSTRPRLPSNPGLPSNQLPHSPGWRQPIGMSQWPAPGSWAHFAWSCDRSQTVSGLEASRQTVARVHIARVPSRRSYPHAHFLLGGSHRHVVAQAKASWPSPNVTDQVLGLACALPQASLPAHVVLWCPSAAATHAMAPDPPCIPTGALCSKAILNRFQCSSWSQPAQRGGHRACKKWLPLACEHRNFLENCSWTKLLWSYLYFEDPSSQSLEVCSRRPQLSVQPRWAWGTSPPCQLWQAVHD